MISNRIIIAALKRLGISPKEIVLDGGFNVGPSSQTLDAHGLAPYRVFISGRPRLQTHQTPAPAWT